MQTLWILKKHKKILTIFEISKMNDSKQPIENTLTKKVYLFTFILLFFSPFSYSQNTLHGLIQSQSNEPIPFSSIVVKQHNSVSNQEYTTLSDLSGSFFIKSLDTGSYNIKITAVGFKCYESQFVAKLGDNIIQNIELSPDTISIPGVEIKAGRITTYADKKVYAITNEDREQVNNGLDLVKIIPQLSIDEINNKVLLLSGGGVKILINGVYADENELLLLKPQEIYKIEYYNRPGARYLTENVASVINVITKDKVLGVYGYCSLRNAFTTGFGNDATGIKYTRKNVQLAINYDAEYRKNNNSLSNEDLEYNIGGKTYLKIREGISGNYKYTDRSLEISLLSNQKKSDLKLSFNINTFDLNKTNDQEILGNSIMAGFSNVQGNTYYSKPYVDIYFLKRLKKNNELALNLVASSYNSSYLSTIYEFHNQNDTIQYLYSDQKSVKKSIISEIYYAMNLKNGNKINSGFKSTYSWMQQNTSSVNLDETKAGYFDGFLYTEYVGQIKNVGYTSGVGVQNCLFQSKSDLDDYKENIFRPYFKAIYSKSEKSEAEFFYQRIPNFPTIGNMSNGIVLLDSLLINIGNPSLKPYSINEYSLSYTHNFEKLTILPSMKFSFASNPITTYFRPHEEYLSLTQINCKSRTEYNINLLIDYKPFKTKWLRLQAYGSLSKIDFNIENNIHSELIPIFVVFTNIYYKDIAFSANFQSVVKSFTGQTVTNTSSILYTDIKWKKKNLSIALGIRYPFYENYYKNTSTYQENTIKIQSNEKIYDFANMLMLRLYYSFSIGKQVNVSKIIENNDSDNGLINNTKN